MVEFETFLDFSSCSGLRFFCFINSERKRFGCPTLLPKRLPWSHLCSRWRTWESSVVFFLNLDGLQRSPHPKFRLSKHFNLQALQPKHRWDQGQQLGSEIRGSNWRLSPTFDHFRVAIFVTLSDMKKTEGKGFDHLIISKAANFELICALTGALGDWTMSFFAIFLFVPEKVCTEIQGLRTFQPPSPPVET